MVSTGAAVIERPVAAGAGFVGESRVATVRFFSLACRATIVLTVFRARRACLRAFLAALSARLQALRAATSADLAALAVSFAARRPFSAVVTARRASAMAGGFGFGFFDLALVFISPLSSDRPRPQARILDLPPAA